MWLVTRPPTITLQRRGEEGCRNGTQHQPHTRALESCCGRHWNARCGPLRWWLREKGDLREITRRQEELSPLLKSYGWEWFSQGVERVLHRRLRPPTVLQVMPTPPPPATTLKHVKSQIMCEPGEVESFSVTVAFFEKEIKCLTCCNSYFLSLVLYFLEGPSRWKAGNNTGYVGTQDSPKEKNLGYSSSRIFFA